MATRKSIELTSIEQLVASLNTAGVKYLVVGGIAVIAHGHARLTMDVDLVIALNRDNIEKAISALQQVGYRPQIPVAPEEFLDADTRHNWSEQKHMVVFQWTSEKPGYPAVDIFVQEPFDFETEYDRAVSFELSSEIRLPVVSLEALIDMKQQTGRDKDLDDISNLTPFLNDES